MVNDHYILVHIDGSTVYFTNTNTANVLVVVNGADQYLGRCLGIPFRSRNVIQNGIEQRSHVFALHLRIKGSITSFCGSIDKRAVKLLIAGLKVHQKFQNFVYYFSRTSLWTVDLVNTYDNRQVQFQCFLQYEFGLRHGSFKSIHNKDDTVYHFQYTLNLAAEVCMTWGVDDIDFCILIKNSGIFGENGDSSFSLNVVGVHDSLSYFLIGTEHTALFQKLIDQSGFTMVYMSDDGNISYIFSLHI